MRAAVISVLVAAAEALAEVVVVVGLVNIGAVIAIVGVLVGVILLVIAIPLILAGGLAGAKPFSIPVVDRLAKHLRPILVGFVIIPVAIVAIAGSGIEVGVAVIVASALQIYLLLAQPRQVLLLEAVFRHPVLLL